MEKKYRFNLIDALVLALIAVIVVIVVGKVRLAKQQRTASQVETTAISGPGEDFTPNLRFEAVAEGLDPALAERLAAEPANRIYNSYQFYNAYITARSVEPCYLSTVGPDGQAQTAVDPLHVNLRFVIEAELRDTDAYASVGGNFNACLGAQEIRLGKLYTVKTLTIEIPATVVRLEAPIHE